MHISPQPLFISQILKITLEIENCDSTPLEL